jgi:gluconolactonase
MISSPETVATGISFPEGLAWSAAEQALYCTGVQAATVHRIEVSSGSMRTLADLGGGANNLVLSSDGGCLVTQNGGIDSNAGLLSLFPEASAGPEIRPRQPGIARITVEGEVSYLLDHGVNAPNDLAVDDSGTIFFTDPGNPYAQDRGIPRVMRYGTDGNLECLAEGFDYCNGIVIDGGNVLVTDHGGVIRIDPDGRREWLAKFEGGVDGLALDADGRLYVTGQADGIIRIFDDGVAADALRVGRRACVTNCCFGGETLRDLFATDAVTGSVVVFSGMPTAGRPVNSWPAQSFS